MWELCELGFRELENSNSEIENPTSDIRHHFATLNILLLIRESETGVMPKKWAM